MHPWSHPFLRDAFRPIVEPQPEAKANIVPLKPKIGLDSWSKPSLQRPPCSVLSFPAENSTRKGRLRSYSLLSSVLSKVETLRQKHSNSGVPK